MTTVQSSSSVWQRQVTLPVGIASTGNGRSLRQATLRKMTGQEEALLADPTLRSNGGKLITALLTNCVKDLGGQLVNETLIRQLTSADRNFLLLELRRLTFGDEMEANYRCLKCQGVTPVVENLSDLEVRSTENGAIPNIPVRLQDGYQDPDGNWQYDFLFELPTGEDEEAAASRRDPNPTRQRDALLARCLQQVGELEDRRIRALGSRILSDLSMGDRRLIQQAMDAQTPGPDLTRSIICRHCGEEYRTALDMSRFFPLA